MTRVALKSIQGDDLMAALAELTSRHREAEDCQMRDGRPGSRR